MNRGTGLCCQKPVPTDFWQNEGYPRILSSASNQTVVINIAISYKCNHLRYENGLKADVVALRSIKTLVTDR